MYLGGITTLVFFSYKMLLYLKIIINPKHN